MNTQQVGRGLAGVRVPSPLLKRRVLRNRALMLGGSLLLVIVGAALFAPILAPYNPLEIHPDRALEGSSAAFLLGTDMFGRDQLSRILYGARISLYVGMVSVSIALALGGCLGVVAAFFGGLFDNLIMRVMDVLLAFPAILLAIAIMAAFGSSLTNVMVAIGIVYTPIFARIARAAALTVMRQTYVEAGQALGVSWTRLLFRHVLPNATGPIIVQTSLSLAFAILAEAALSFLGLGTQPPTPSWGLMLNDGRNFFSLAPWLAVYPGLAISLTVLALNLLGDGLRDVLDPRF